MHSMNILKAIKLYTLNGWTLSCVNYLNKAVKKSTKMQSSEL